MRLHQYLMCEIPQYSVSKYYIIPYDLLLRLFFYYLISSLPFYVAHNLCVPIFFFYSLLFLSQFTISRRDDFIVTSLHIHDTERTKCFFLSSPLSEENLFRFEKHFKCTFCCAPCAWSFAEKLREEAFHSQTGCPRARESKDEIERELG